MVGTKVVVGISAPSAGFTGGFAAAAMAAEVCGSAVVKKFFLHERKNCAKIYLSDIGIEFAG